MIGVNTDELRVELARRKMRQMDLAKLLRVPPTTLSSWLVGYHPVPDGLAARIESALGVRPGSLVP